jgi:hypothetical protein
MGRYTENRTETAVFLKTDTDVGIRKTEKYRIPNKKYRYFGFFGII